MTEHSNHQMQELRSSYNQFIAFSTVIMFIIFYGYSFKTLSVVLILNLIWAIFLSDKWYDFMDSLRNTLVSKIR